MRRIWFLMPLVLTASALAQTSTTQPTTAPADNSGVVLGKVFRSRMAGIQFNPPAGGSMIRELKTGDIVRFVYSDQGWDVRVKPVPLHVPLALSAPPDQGVLELTVNQLVQSNPTAKILRSEVVSIHGHDVGRLEATYKAGTDHLFAQQALFEESPRYYLSVQMTCQSEAKDFPHDRMVFDQMLNSVAVLNRDELAREQNRRLLETRGLWVLLDRRTILAALQPLHFMRVVRGGRDVGFIQMNERAANHNGHDGIEVIIHSRVEAEQPTGALAATPNKPAQGPGMVIPKSLTPAAAPAAGPTAELSHPKNLYTFSTYFVTFDRDHEDWTSVTQTDENVAGQVTETAYADRTIHRRIDPTRLHASTTQHLDDPPVIEIPKYLLDVIYTVGKHDQAPIDLQLPPWYLPQALGQMLPRLLPPDPAQYAFGFYVSSEHELLYRYIDVEAPREVEIDGQTVRAIPITDRIGVDGQGTTHYVTRRGEWLGSVSDDGHLQVFPTDEHTLKGLWPGFVVSPEPAENDQPDNTLAPPMQNPQDNGR